MNPECDIKMISNEDLLKKMWHQTEDLDRRQEIHSHLYKLREARLRDLYNGDSNIMAEYRGSGFGKDPLMPSHGDSLIDQSFQSLKSKEVRDSLSPIHDMKFHSLTLNQPNNTGWDVQTSSEMSPDGRNYRSETLAKTDGVEKIDGGVAAYQGRNEQRSSASHEGDDKNYVKKASESSKTQLHENVVIGDLNSGRTEIKSSSKTSSSSQMISSSSSSAVYHDGDSLDNQLLIDDQLRERRQHLQNRQYINQEQEQQQQRQREQQYREQQNYLQKQQQQRYEHQEQEEHLRTTRNDQTEMNQNYQNISSNTTKSDYDQIQEENKRYVDLDKTSPEYQQRVKFLMAQPGEIISNKVEYPKPNVKMITTVKRLPDGTIVKNKRYETEELRPSSDSSRERLVSQEINQTNKQSKSERRQQDQENIYKSSENNRYTEIPIRHTPDDSIDNREKFPTGHKPANQPNRYTNTPSKDSITEDTSNISSTYSSVEKSSKRFSTESTSEIIKETADRPSSYLQDSPVRPRNVANNREPDFTTHGFPSVRPNKPTQEYPTARPQIPKENYRNIPSHPTTPSTKPISEFDLSDGEITVVSETKSSAKTNVERVVETESITNRDYETMNKINSVGVKSVKPDFSTHGFPSVRDHSSPKGPSPSVDTRRPSEYNTQPDFSTHGFPSVKPQSPRKEPSETFVQKRHPSEKSTPDFSTHGFPSVKEYSPRSENKIKPDFSTHGFPSVREYPKTPNDKTPYAGSPRQPLPREDFTTNGFPSVKQPNRQSTENINRISKEVPIVATTSYPQQKTPTSSTTNVNTIKKDSVSKETTYVSVKKEREVDAAHRAFAASLRSSSPADSIRRDSYSDQQRATPRSSVSSNRTTPTTTTRREFRERSHESIVAPSESSRISTSTITRQSPSKGTVGGVGGRTPTTKHTTPKTIDVTQRSTKSPTKTITTTKVKKTTVGVPASENQINKPAASKFNINETTLTTKNHQNYENDASFPGNEVVEEPCIKKYYYQLGPSDKASHSCIENSPNSPQSNEIQRTHPERERDYESPDNFSENDFDNNEPDVNQTDDEIIPNKYKEVPKTKTVARETTFEKSDIGDYKEDTNENYTSLPHRGPKGSRNTISDSVDKTNYLIKETHVRPKETKNIKVMSDEFIEKEKIRERPQPKAESPDGSFVSKQFEPDTKRPMSPTYRKKGLSRSETFEERCRQILGMEDSGDTQGTYVSRKDSQEIENTKEVKEHLQTRVNGSELTPRRSDVQIEDCDEDDTNYRTEYTYKRVSDKEVEKDKGIKDETPRVEPFDTPSSKSTFIERERKIEESEKSQRNRATTKTDKEISTTKKSDKPIKTLPDDVNFTTSDSVDVKKYKNDIRLEQEERVKKVTKDKLVRDINEKLLRPFDSPEAIHICDDRITPSDRKRSPERSDQYPTSQKPSTDEVIYDVNEKEMISSYSKTKVTKTDEDFIQNTEENILISKSPVSERSRTSSPEGKFSPHRKSKPENIKYPQDKYSPERKKLNEREPSNQDKFSPQREISPKRKISPQREHLPRREQTPVTKDKPKLTPSPKESNIRKQSPPNKQMPNRKLSPQNKQPRDYPTDRIHPSTQTQSPQDRKSPQRKYSPERESAPQQSPGRSQPSKYKQTPQNSHEYHPEPEKGHLTESKHSPDRGHVVERKILPERQHSPHRKYSPERQHTPDRKHSPERQDLPERRRSPERQHSPEGRHFPERKHSPEDKHVPRRQHSPEQRDSPLRKYSPERQHSPQRRDSPERQHSPERRDSPERKYSPEWKHSPQSKYSPEEKHLPERKQSPERRRSPEWRHPSEFRHSPERTYSPERRHSPEREPSPEHKYLPNSKHPEMECSPEERYSPSRMFSPEEKYPADHHLPSGPKYDRQHSPESIRDTKYQPQSNNSSPNKRLTEVEHVPESNRSPVVKPTNKKGPSPKGNYPQEPTKPSSTISNKSKTLKSSNVNQKTQSKTTFTSNEKSQTTQFSTKTTTKSRDDTKSLKKTTSVEKIHTKNTDKQKPTPALKSRKTSGDNLLTQKTTRKTMNRKADQQTDDESNKSTRSISPTPSTQRRRSSNISVHTEIVIEHSGPKSPKSPHRSTLQARTDEDLIRNLQYQKNNKKILVTERKESAPVQRVTRTDKDNKMSRSTSENVIKNINQTTKKPITTTDSLRTSERRPNKCLTTKSINLSTFDQRLLRDEKDEENVIIDIQHAKSSREPSPDKIVPTPVPTEVDTGKPRYPDVVQEPEDEPRKRPVVKNIPILEEDTNEFIGCQIVEVNVNKPEGSSGRTKRKHYDNDDVLSSPTIEAPDSYSTLQTNKDDVCLLSVHDKVSKFTLTAEEDRKPKASGKFQREIDYTQNVPEDDDCLLTVDQKVNKFLKTAQKITDETFTSSKIIECSNDYQTKAETDYNHYNIIIDKPKTLADTLPQKSPELVANIEKKISRPRQPEQPKQNVRGRSPSPSQPGSPHFDQDRPTYREYEKNDDRGEDENPDELVPMSKTHTTNIELKRQKDILSRVSVFEDNRRKSKIQKGPTDDVSPVRKEKEKITPNSTDDKSKASPHKPVDQKRPLKDTEKVGPKVNEPNGRNIYTTKILQVKQKFEPERDQEQVTKSQNVRKEKSEMEETEMEAEYETSELKRTVSDRKQRVIEEIRKSTRSKSDRTDLPIEGTDSDVEQLQDQNTSDNEEIDYFITFTKEKSPRKASVPSSRTPLKEKSNQPKPTISHSPAQSPQNKRLPATKTTDRKIEHTQTKYKSKRTESDHNIDSSINIRRPGSPLKKPSTKYIQQSQIPSDTLIQSDDEIIGSDTEQFDDQSVNDEEIDYFITFTKEKSTKGSSKPSPRVTTTEKSSPSKQISPSSVQSPRGKKSPTSKVTSRQEETDHTLDSSVQKKTMTGRLNVSSESVAARRNIFERVNSPQTGKPAQSKARSASPQQARRPSYMDHTKSSLEHIRRDSLEINKNHYSRKPSIDDQIPCDERLTTSAVKFVIPSHSHPDVEMDSEEINIEEIFDLVILEQMLETVKSYDLRRRIRAQIRLVKKNIENITIGTQKNERIMDERQVLSEKKAIKSERSSSKTSQNTKSIISKDRDRSRSPDYIPRDGYSNVPKSESPDRSEFMDTDDIETNNYYSNERTENFQQKMSKSERYKSSETITEKASELNTRSVPGQQPTTRRDHDTKQAKSPIWANRDNILKNSTKYPVKTTQQASSSRTSKTVSTTSQNRNQVEDCITSSYGIGPTDENGLPLFGIKALKKKSKSNQPGETTTEITGYVVEQKYYADDDTQPTVERKELIYSTNPDEIEDIRKKLKAEVSPPEGVARLQIEKKYMNETDMAEPNKIDEMLSSTKYIRRGSVKEMSEKFIRKESSQSITEKSGSSSSYPKAGLILRTNSRSGLSDDADNYESSHKMRKKVHNKQRSEDDDDIEYRKEMISSHHLAKEVGSDDNESRSVRKEMKKIEKSTRSFLNSSKESRQVRDVDDALERMRNADNVVEDGDSPEDQEARALLNKFLGASVIMSGVETALPTKKTKLSADDENFSKQQLKTIRVTKTTKSESSSSPVARKTCDIEEIWDEELLKQLLEQATDYEERRIIRARLRQLMAEREECKIVSAVNSELEPKSADDGDESSASEYEEIIEEVTDYSDTNSDADADPVNEVDTVKEKELVKQASSKDIAVAKESQSTEILAVVDADNSAAEDATTVNECQVESRKEIRETCKNEVTESESGVNGELLTPTLQHLLPYKTPQIKETATQNSLRSVNSLKTLDTRTNINNIENSISSESSNRLSVSANNKYLHTNNNNKSNNNNNTYNDYDDDNNTKDDNMRPIMMTTMTEKQNKKPASDLSVSTANLVREQLGIPTREDSGTESGDDLRLIAAGIRDKLNMQSDTNLIQEVTAALNRLECSLKEGKDISLDERKRNALLALVERLQSGLTSPEKLADDGEREMVETSMNDTFENDDETSSPEADTHRTSRQRFAKRRIRNSRHTVGVSREELEDARRYMEDMFLMENFSTPTTPEGNPLPPSWNPIVKNLSSGAILMTQPGLNLCRPNQFVPNNLKNSTDYQRHDKVTTMPISGDYSLSTSKLNAIEKKEPFLHQTNAHQAKKGETSLMGYRNFYSRSPEFPEKSNRFSNKKLLMKRANTIDIPKAKNSSIDFETDSDADEKNPTTGLKRTVQVNVKRQVRNVVPPFEPKTENDHKFLAFINKQSASPGLGWNNSKSVTNWTNKFGSIKHAFEMGAAAAATSGKPPQVPAHATQNSAKLHWQKHEQQHQQQQQQKQTFGEPAYSSNARTQRSQKEQFTTTEKCETKENDGEVVTTTTKVTTRTVSQAPKPTSPFAKFKQLDAQNSQQSQKSPSTPTAPGGSASGTATIFKFTDPALNARAATVKEQLLQWCQIKTKEYENIQINNFSTSWSDGLAFCALIHHFLPDAFDYNKLTSENRKYNFELAFTVADEKAGIAPLLDVEDMVEMKRPDWKCVFVYVQSIYRRFRNCQ